MTAYDDFKKAHANEGWSSKEMWKHFNEDYCPSRSRAPKYRGSYRRY